MGVGQSLRGGATFSAFGRGGCPEGGLLSKIENLRGGSNILNGSEGGLYISPHF